MKKAWLVVVLVAVGGMAARSFADVQNIRLSGDIRLRGYLLDNTGDNGSGDQLQGSDSFISQRTRVSVEADLEDHVLVVVTLKAEGLWGHNDEANGNSGAGVSQSDFNINRGFDVGVNEAYVQLNELFYTPATLKVGRQYLHYGRGLILSSAEQEYNYDAGRLVLDYYPLTIDVVGAELVNSQSFSPTPSREGAVNLLFLNARYEMSDSAIKAVEAYFGWVAQGSSGTTNSTRVPPSDPINASGASPWIVGLRSDMNLTEGLNTWIEGAYEGGSAGAAFNEGVSAFIANVGGRYTLKDVTWSPVINANYIYASGGGTDGRSQFRPWFDYAEGYNGYLFAPALANIHIFNLGASVKPYENTTLSLQGYYYLKADKDSGVGVSASNPNADFGGLGFVPTAASRELGWEFDAILGYDYSKDVRAQLVYAAFIPEGAFKHGDSDSVAHELRGEINVKF